MIYLAGAISQISKTEATYWRNQVKEIFPGSCIDPTDFEFDGKVHDPKEIIRADLIAIATCRVVLANVGAPSWGTGMEIFFAARQQSLPVIAFGPPDISPWIRGHCTLVGGLDAAIKELWNYGY